MKDIEIVYLNKNIDRSKLKDPIMIVGLPGIGHVGKFVVDYLVDFFNADPIIEIYSKYFPPQVLINNDNTVSFLKNKICLAHTDDHDYFFLIGDYQSNESKGHYDLCEIYIDIALEFRINKIFTLGGYLNLVLPRTCVLGSVNDISMIEELKKYDVQFKKFEPIGGIVGISGLLLAFAAQKKIKSVCLMGMTSGYVADPKCSKNLLLLLSKILNLNIKEDALDTQIQDMEKIIGSMKESSFYNNKTNAKEEDLIYFG